MEDNDYLDDDHDKDDDDEDDKDDDMEDNDYLDDDDDKEDDSSDDSNDYLGDSDDTGLGEEGSGDLFNKLAISIKITVSWYFVYSLWYHWLIIFLSYLLK